MSEKINYSVHVANLRRLLKPSTDITTNINQQTNNQPNNQEVYVPIIGKSYTPPINNQCSTLGTREWHDPKTGETVIEAQFSIK